MKKVDNLFEDPIISNQQYCCISFISPEGIKNCSLRGIKVRGVYKTEEEARERAKYLQQLDPDFHVFVGEVGKWLPWDPDPNSIDDQIYREEKLQEIVSGYKKNMIQKQIMEEERKREILEENVRKEITKSKSQKKREKQKQKLDNKKIEDKLKEIAENRFKNNINEDSDNENEENFDNNTLVDVDLNKSKKLEKEKEILEKKEEEIKRSVENMTSIDEKLNHLQKMYKEMLNNKNTQHM